MTTTMVDCEAADIPAMMAQYGKTLPVAGYVSGGWPVEWTEPDFALFPRKIRIFQQPYEPGDDSAARVLDIEPNCATPDDWPAFYADRAEPSKATCYCSLDDIAGVVEACQQAHVPLPPRWWLAWYWERPGEPAANIVQAQALSVSGYTLPLDVIWACQYDNQPAWDLSIVYGKPDFARR